MAPAVTPCFFHCVFPFFPGTPSSLVCLRTCVSCVGAASCLRSTWAITTPLCNHLINCSMRTLAFSPPLARFSFIQAFCDISSLPAISLPTSTTLHWSSPCQVHAYNSESFPCTFCNESLKTCLCVRFCVLKKHRTSHDKVFFFLLVISPSSSTTKEQSGLHTCSLYIHEG